MTFISQAIKDGNKIWGVVRTGSNHDGRTAQPITSPSGEQQYKLFDSLYKTSGIDPSSVQYIEMHGMLFFMICVHILSSPALMKIRI